MNSASASASSSTAAYHVAAPLSPRTHGASSCYYKPYLINEVQRSRVNKRDSVMRVKAAANDGNKKRNSVICADCDGNGAVVCSQCKGCGVNSVDFFGGQFKAGDSCWLCGGKKDMLCGNCNGAGFIGGFMSTKDE